MRVVKAVLAFALLTAPTFAQAPWKDNPLVDSHGRPIIHLAEALGDDPVAFNSTAFGQVELTCHGKPFKAGEVCVVEAPAPTVVTSHPVLLTDAPLTLTGTTTIMSDEDFINKVYYPATVLLYAQDERGSLNMLCTATAIDKQGDDYTFATAAHCASKDDEDTHTASAEKKFFFISPDKHDVKAFTRAYIIGCGYQHRGDDFCLFKVTTKDLYPTVPIGVDSSSFGGEQIVNVAAPLGLGKQVLYGRISMPKLDRPVVENDINWTDAIILQMENTNGGSSGSSIVCIKQHAICGFLVGTIAGNTTIAIPISHFKTFREATATKKYKWFVDADDTKKKD